MIEFTIAVVAVLAVAAGLLLLNRLALARTNTMLTARGQAGALALSALYQGTLDSDFIADWQTGPDGATYTADDQPLSDLSALTLVDALVANAGQMPPGPLATNALARLSASPDPINEFYLVKGRESLSVDLTDIPAIGNLISGEPEIAVESEAWLPWSEGIY